MTNFSIFDILELQPLERGVFLQVARNGPSDVEALAVATGHDQATIRKVLNALVQKRRIQLSRNGRADVIMGHVRRRATLPSQLWPVLLTTGRLYSEQEIATLRTVVPILQLARARLTEFTDHGPNHALRVKSFASQLGVVMDLSAAEHHLLRVAALFHDVGNIVDRHRHHIISQETVERLAAMGELPFSHQEAALIGLVCRWHRREYEPQRIDQLRNEPIRTGLLASILRVADAMDIDQRRSDYTERFARVLQIFFDDQLPYWASIEEILGVRICCTPVVEIQVFTRGRIQDNMQIAMLRGDLERTPLEWSVREIAVDDSLSNDIYTEGDVRRSAILAFPFEPHSIVMAARSRVHLEDAGYRVEVLCYPDTQGGASWLWSEALAEANPTGISRLVVIGAQPDEKMMPNLFGTIARWQAAETSVSILNRHEASWTAVPQLLQRGVEVVLGGDWAYFWGNVAETADLVWGRIAALCTRDPTQSSIGLTAEELQITQGLLKVVYDATSKAAEDTAGWAALAEPILERIAADDRTYFMSESDDFAATYATTPDRGRVEGRVVSFSWPAHQFPRACYWALEATLERLGRSPERGISFNIQYAIATWRDGDMVELLAINHWREEEAIPIRLLYPSELGPPPEGNESTVHVRLSVSQAERVVEALIAACNRQ